MIVNDFMLLFIYIKYKYIYICIFVYLSSQIRIIRKMHSFAHACTYKMTPSPALDLIRAFSFSSHQHLSAVVTRSSQWLPKVCPTDISQHSMWTRFPPSGWWLMVVAGRGKSSGKMPCPASNSTGLAKSFLETIQRPAAWLFVMVGKRSKVKWTPRLELFWVSITQGFFFQDASPLFEIFWNAPAKFLRHVVVNELISFSSSFLLGTRMLLKVALGKGLGHCHGWRSLHFKTPTMYTRRLVAGTPYS